MKNTVRLIAAALVLSVAACAHHDQPPVKPATGKDIVPMKKK